MTQNTISHEKAISVAFHRELPLIPVSNKVIAKEVVVLEVLHCPIDFLTVLICGWNVITNFENIF